MASPAEILGFIAAHEPLENTRAHFGVGREQLRALLRAAAVLMQVNERPAAPEPPAVEAPAVPLEGGPLPARPGASTPHPGRLLRVFCDGAARGNPGPAGAGVVIAKADGAIVTRLGRYLGTQTNNVAEYTALLLGLEAALSLGADEVEVVADSELLVRQLNGAYKVRSAALKPLFDQARVLLGRFRKSSVRHVPREQNALADEMSNRAIDELM